MKFLLAVLSVMVCSAMAQVPLLGKGAGIFSVRHISGAGYGYNPYNNYGYSGYDNGKGVGNIGVAGAGYGYNPYNNYGYSGYGKGKGVGNIGVAGAGYGYNPYNNNYGYNGYGYGKGVGNVGVGKAYGNDYNPSNYNNKGKAVAGHGAGLVGHGTFVGHGPFTAGHGPFVGHSVAGHGVYGHGGPFVGHGVAGSFINKASPYYYQ